MKKERCKCCNTGIDQDEIYTDFFYCGVCHKNFPYPQDCTEKVEEER